MIAFQATSAADRDIEEIVAFFGPASVRSQRFGSAFEDAIQHLRSWPRSGHRRRDLTKRDLCFWTFGDYYLVFHLQPDLLSIVAILHTSRNVARILRSRLRKPPLLT